MATGAIWRESTVEVVELVDAPLGVARFWSGRIFPGPKIGFRRAKVLGAQVRDRFRMPARNIYRAALDIDVLHLHTSFLLLLDELKRGCKSVSLGPKPQLGLVPCTCAARFPEMRRVPSAVIWLHWPGARSHLRGLPFGCFLYESHYARGSTF